MDETDFTLSYKRVHAPLAPWKQFGKIRRALEAFYPKSEDNRRECLARSFADFRPLASPRMTYRVT